MGLALETARRDIAIRASNEPAGVLAARYGLTAAHVNRIRSSAGRPLTNKERFQLEVVEGGWAAACMSPADWSEWVRTNPVASQTDRDIAVRPCHDCPIEFAAEMRAAGRCNGTPGTNDAASEEEIQLEPVAARVPTGGAAHRFTKLPPEREERMRVVLEAVRSTGSHAEAGLKLGVSGARVEQIVSELRRAGQLPADVDALLRSRTTKRPRVGDTAIAIAEARVAAQRTPPSEEPSVLPDAVETPRERPTAELAPSDPARPSSSGLRDDVGQHGASAAAEAPWHQEPCRSCLHRRVCSIRDEVQRIAEAIALTDVPPVVHLELSCGHYLPDVTVAS